MLHDRAIQRIIFGEKSDGKSLSFVEVLEDEVQNYALIQQGSTSHQLKLLHHLHR
jgi:hypothetical protein